MRLSWVAVVLLAAGCVSPPSGPATTPPTSCGPDCPSETPRPTQGTPAPTLAPGTALRYHMHGIYNGERDVTVVVASRNASGYLFAGASKEDIVPEAVWGNEWFGPHTLGLDRAGKDAVHLLDFPLQDGKTWTYWKETTVVAREAAGQYHIQANDGKRTLNYDYDPEVGYLSRFESSTTKPYQAIDLKDAGKATQWWWYVAGPSADSGSGASAPATLTVPDGYDAVLVSPGGTSGSVVVVPPGGGQPWTWQAAGPERWDYATLPATAGAWILKAAPGADPEGFAYVRAVAVKWTSGTVAAS